MDIYSYAQTLAGLLRAPITPMSALGTGMQYGMDGLDKAQKYAQGLLGDAALNSFGSPAVATAAYTLPVALGMMVNPTRNIPKTQYELAHDLAQKNAVDMLGLADNNTYLDRAKALAGLLNPDLTNTTKSGMKEIKQSDAVSRLHDVGNLQFNVMPISEYKKNGSLLYKSPSYNGKQSSEYKIGLINNEPVYMRKSDHWGAFGTNVKEGTNEGDAMFQIGSEGGDNFGRMGKAINNWELSGGIADTNSSQINQIENNLSSLREGAFDKTGSFIKPGYDFDSWMNAKDKLIDDKIKLLGNGRSQAGYIPLSSIDGRITEKIRTDRTPEGNLYDAPLVKLPNGNFRSRFAAFDPAQIDSKNIMAGVGGMSLSGLLGLSLLSNKETDNGI